MKVYTFSQARQNLSEVLNCAKGEKVVIRRRAGDAFVVVAQKAQGSPFDVAGVKTQASTGDILTAVRESRSKTSKQRH